MSSDCDCKDKKTGGPIPGGHEIRPAPTPYAPEGKGYAEIVAPCDGKVYRMKDLPAFYLDYAGRGVGFIPDCSDFDCFMNGEVMRIISDKGAIVVQNPTFGCSVFFQVGIYMDEAKGKNTDPEKYLPPKIKGPDAGGRSVKGEFLFSVDFKDLEKVGRSTMCVLMAQKGVLEKNKQKIELEKFESGAKVKKGTVLFTFVKDDSVN